MKSLLACCVLLSLICGCATVGRKLDPNKVAQIQKGVTTRNEVVGLIGSPDQMTRDGDGNVTFQYLYVRATAKGSSFIPVYGAFAGGANVQNQTVMVVFNPDGVCKDIISSYGATEADSGLNTSPNKASLPEVEDNKRPK